jgi:ADP-heptose:LPS heptosyltransferase
MPLFAHAPGIARRIVVRKRSWGRHWLGLWAACAGTSWRTVIDLRGSALGYVLRAGERRVYRPASAAEPRLVTLARVLGIAPPPPRLWLEEAEHDAAAALVGEDPFLALGPTANWPGKVWPAERFVAVARALVGAGGPLAGARIVVLGGAGEEAVARPVLDGLPGALDLVGRTPLLVAGAVLARAALFVGNDSGLMHMAAAAGAPTVGVFGPSRAEHYGPWGPRAAAVRTPEPYEALFPPGYDRRTTGSLMGSLTVEPVLAACRRVLAEPGPAR